MKDSDRDNIRRLAGDIVERRMQADDDQRPAPGPPDGLREGLSAIGCVRLTSTVADATTCEQRYYIVSTAMDARTFAEAVRGILFMIFAISLIIAVILSQSGYIEPVRRLQLVVGQRVVLKYV